MSRGPGKVERAIETAFRAEPERCFSVADLCVIAYPQFDRWSSATDRKYRVVVRSAARRVARRLRWSERRRWGPGDPLEFVNSLPLESEGNV